MKKIMIVMCLFTGCTASFQPFPGVSKSDFDQTNQNVLAIAQVLNKMQAVMVTKTPDKEVKK